MTDTADKKITAGGGLLTRLSALGVDCIFANSGTDFPPIIEGLAEAKAKGLPLPRTVTAPHETAAVGMAHGYYLATGRPQAVIVHTNVGLANTAMGAINAATEHVPMLLFSGRTPVMEKGRFGGRTVPIGWGQEMRDQHALVREASKWDYELHFPEQVGEVVDRALAVATSTPQGPVYLSLPREVLCEPIPEDRVTGPARIAPAIASPDAGALGQAIDLLAKAKAPLIIAQRGPESEEGFAALGRLALTWGIPVVQYWMISPSLPGSHPMNCGEGLVPWIGAADVILVVDCLAPWSPAVHKLHPDAKVIHIGEDPLYARFPVRNFQADLSLAGPTGRTILALEAALAPLATAQEADLSARRDRVAGAGASLRAAGAQKAQVGSTGRMSKEWVSQCLARALQGRRSVVFSELGCLADSFRAEQHKGWYQGPHSGGLGWCFPAAMGMKLGDPDRLVVATMGDGSYMFANPVACHQIAEANDIPLLLLVLNNAGWGAVRASVSGLYPGGYAARSNDMPLVGLSPSPDFTSVAKASRAWAQRVERGEDLAAALDQAIEVVTSQRRFALLDIQIKG